MNDQIIESDNCTVIAYKSFFAQIQELRQLNQTLVFDYEDVTGNKDARSHVYKLRKTKSAIDKVRKAAGNDARKLLSTINAEGNSLISEVEEMIHHHQKHIDEVEQIELARVNAIKSRMAEIEQFRAAHGLSSAELTESLNKLRSINIDSSFNEYLDSASKSHIESMDFLTSELAIAMDREAKYAELEQLKKEASERDAKQREEQLARDEAEHARRAEVTRLELEIESAKARELELKKTIENEATQKIASEAAQKVDLEQRNLIDSEIADQLIRVCSFRNIKIDCAAANLIVVSIREGLVAHVAINYGC